MKEGRLCATRAGIGIHTGEAVTGNIGTSTRQQYSITGNVVIMASRIEQLNKQLQTQLLISEEVRMRLNAGAVSWIRHHNIVVRGFEKPVTLYQLL